MVFPTRSFVIVISLLTATFTALVGASGQPAPAEEPGQLIVGFHQMPNLAAGDVLFDAHVRGVVPQVRAAFLQAPDLDAVAEAARKDPNVRYVEYDPRNVPPPFTPNDPESARDWGWGPRAMNTGLAWDATRGNGSLVVGVIDTGLNPHEDIDPSRVATGYDFWAFDPTPEDPPECNHGTGVTSVLAATLNNGKGMSGMAQVQVMPLKIYGGVPCGGSYGSLGQALVHGADQGVRLFSIQWQGRNSMQFVNDSVAYAYNMGAILVVSAGNWGACATSCVAQTWIDNSDKAIVVAAMNQDRSRAGFSSVGPEVDVTAPGSNLVGASSLCETCYQSKSGTSFSTPHAAGVVALMRSAVPGASREVITQRLFATAVDVGAAGKDDEHGHGFLDAGTAVARWPEAFDAKFRNVGGNEWWVQAHVDANHPVTAVHARKGTEAWRTLSLQSWGGWAASFPIPAGTIVQLRATDDKGATDPSRCYQWPAATVVACPNVDPGTTPVTFEHRGGNEWWVEAKVSPTPVSVQAMDTGGPWVSLEKKSWGNWAGSFHIASGNLVKFRATFSNGTTVESCSFTHPAGVQQCSQGPGPTPNTTFAHKGGNEWWVEARVDPRPSAVYARDTNGAWVALTLRDWGNWAGSFRIEPGNQVQFRAVQSDGKEVESCWFTHPGGAVASCTTDPKPVPFDATFSSVKGNEWWVETVVKATGGTLARVDARVNGGPWVALEHKSWGAWAKSIHAPRGSTVEFRAVATDGQQDMSGKYVWPPA